MGMEGVCLDPLVQRAQKLGWGRTDRSSVSGLWEEQGAPTQKLGAATLTHPCLDCSAARFPLASRWRPPDRGARPRPPSAGRCCAQPSRLFGLERKQGQTPMEVRLFVSLGQREEADQGLSHSAPTLDFPGWPETVLCVSRFQGHRPAGGAGGHHGSPRFPPLAADVNSRVLPGP